MPLPWCLQVLHTRSRSGTGLNFVRFLAACYLTFNMDCDSVAKAQETLPTLPTLRRAIAPGQWSFTAEGSAFMHPPIPVLSSYKRLQQVRPLEPQLVWQLLSCLTASHLQ